MRCVRKHFTRGLCKRHHDEARRAAYGTYRASDLDCIVNGCTETAATFKWGRCKSHERLLTHWNVSNHRLWEHERERVADFLNDEGVVNVRWEDIGGALMHLEWIDHEGNVDN